MGAPPGLVPSRHPPRGRKARIGLNFLSMSGRHRQPFSNQCGRARASSTPRRADSIVTPTLPTLSVSSTAKPSSVAIRAGNALCHRSSSRPSWRPSMPSEHGFERDGAIVSDSRADARDPQRIDKCSNRRAGPATARPRPVPPRFPRRCQDLTNWHLLAKRSSISSLERAHQRVTPPQIGKRSDYRADLAKRKPQAAILPRQDDHYVSLLSNVASFMRFVQLLG